MCTFISKKQGLGGTQSELIADICLLSKIRDHLIIVTDGCVGADSIDESDRKMKLNKIQFNFVTIFVIGRGENLSVGAPYSRNSPNITYQVSEIGVEIPQVKLTEKDMKALYDISNINTYNFFTYKYSNLHNAIQSMSLGTEGNKQLQDQLLQLSPKITNSQTDSSQIDDFYNKMQPLQNMALGALRNTFTIGNIETNLQKLGYEVAANREEAIQFYKKAADIGDANAMNCYANMNFDGDGVHYLKMAADKGNVSAMNNYGHMLKNGDGIAVNKQEAVHYYKIAADKGHENAMNNYCHMLKNGDGIAVNKQEAAQYFKMAADN